MIDLSTIRDIVAIFGVIAGFSYYVLTVRNTRINRDTQLFMQIFSLTNDPDFIKRITEMITEMEWDDWEDFERKYGTSVGNYENYGYRYALWKRYDALGELLRRGLIDGELVYALAGQNDAMWFWDKFGSIIIKY